MKLTVTKTGKLSKCTLAKGETEVVIDQGAVIISQKAFDSCREKITKLVIGEGVTTIEAEACKGMTALIELVLPSTLTSIQQHAFADCTALREILLPDGLSELAWNAFSGCSALETLHLPRTLTKLPSCIHGCDQLKTLEIPESVKMLGLYALLESSIEEIVIPASVEYIESKAFYRCAQLKKVTLPASVTGFGVGVFAECTALEEIVLPAELKIPASQKDKLSYFADCTSLKKAVMTREHAKKLLKATAAQLKKDSMTYSADKDKFGIFEGCTALQEICFIAEDTSRWSDGTCDFKTEADGDHLLKCNKIGVLDYTVPESVSVIEDKAFSENTRLKTLTLNAKIKRLSLRQFAQCKIGVLTVPDTLTEIADNNFTAMRRTNQYGKTEWAEIRISDTHPTYGVQDGLLYTKKDGKPHTLLYNLQPVRWNAMIIPAGVEVLAPACCEDSKQTEIQLPESLRVIGARAFANNRNLEKITLPAGLQELGTDAFLGCRSLVELHVPDSVVCFGEGAIVPKKTVILCSKDSAADRYAQQNKVDVRYVGQGNDAQQEDSLFDWGSGRENQIVCTFFGGAEEITLPAQLGGVPVKGYDSKLLVRGRKKIKKVIVPEGITDIPKDFFAHCDYLENVVLPSTIKSIGSNAFSGCWSLKQIETPEGATDIDGSAFDIGGIGGNQIIIRGRWGSAIHAVAMANGCRFVETDADEQTQQLQTRFSVRENADGTLTILQAYGINIREESEQCEIPESINGRTVTEIDISFSTPYTLVLPKSIRAVHGNLLNKVRKLVIHPENPYIKADELLYYSEGGRVLEGLLQSAAAVRKLIIPDGVEIISVNVFMQWLYMEEMHIPASVRGIRSRMLDGSMEDRIGWQISGGSIRCISGQRGSYAEQLANMNRITFLPDDEGEEIRALRKAFCVYRITEEMTQKFPRKYPERTVGGLAIKEYRGGESEVWIPEQIAGETVCVIDGFGGNSLNVVHIPAAVCSIDGITVQEAIDVSKENPVFFSEDGKLYEREAKRLISCPQHSDLTKFWSEMRCIDKGVFESLQLNELRLPEGVEEWNCRYVSYGNSQGTPVKRLVLPMSLKKMGGAEAEEVVLHDHQLDLLAQCANCRHVIVLDAQGKVKCILLGKLLAELFLASHTTEGLYKYLKCASDEKIAVEEVLDWYDAQHDSFRLKSEDKPAYAMYRLHAPYALGDELRGTLVSYLRRTVKKAAQFAMDAQDITMLNTLIECGVIHSKNMADIMEMFREKEMLEWAAVLLGASSKMQS